MGLSRDTVGGESVTVTERGADNAVSKPGLSVCTSGQKSTCEEAGNVQLSSHEGATRIASRGGGQEEEGGEDEDENIEEEELDDGQIWTPVHPDDTMPGQVSLSRARARARSLSFRLFGVCV